jgi:NifU-like protein involved in Fe-S cluster formation
MIRGAELESLSSFPDDQLISALESDIQPTRIQCALLPLEALRAGLKDYRGE